MSSRKPHVWMALFFALCVMATDAKGQCTSSQSQLTLTIDFTLDNYPDEDAWKLINNTSGITVDSTCFGDYSNGGVATETLCVNPSDSYTLLVLDDYGDGLDGATYELKYTYGGTIGTVSNTNLGIPYPHCGATYSNNVIVDSINFKAAFVPPPPCQTPSNLEAYSWTTGSASLSWQENDTATIWQVEYDTAGFSLGNGSRFISTSNPAVISGLSISTGYSFYVRSICSAGDSSAWAGPFYFKSACDSVTVYPYQENFNDTITCWRKAAENGSTEWELATGTASDISSAYEGSGFMEKDYLNSKALLVSPPFNLASMNANGQIRLFLHRHDLAHSTDKYVVLVNDTPKVSSSDTLLQIFSKTSVAPAVPKKGWYEYFADIPSKYAGKTIYIIIEGTTQRNIFSYDLGVDLFTLQEKPSCASVSRLSAFNFSDSTATLSWQENGNASSWELEYGLKGFTKGNGRSTIVASKQYVLDSLAANTSYDYYVRAICSANDSSIWSGPFTFSTKCSTINSLPYTENFDGQVNSAGEWDCWKIINVDGGDTWRQGNQYLNTTHSAPYAALGMGNGNDHLVSPAIQLPNKPIVLTLWDKVESSTFNNVYEILVSTFGDSIKDFTDTIATINAYQTNWTERKIYLSAYAGQKIRISIHQIYSGADYYGFGIDDLKIDTTAECAEPSRLHAISVADSSATLSWVENGNASKWQIQYGTKGFNMGSGVNVVASQGSITIDSLNSSTSYDFYVRSICSTGDTSGWTGPLTIKTMCAPFAVPYSEDFENNAKIPNCWRQGIENMEKWLFEDSIAGINHVGDLGHFNSTTISGGHFAYVDDSSPHGSTTSLLSPLFDLTNVQDPMLSFFRISNNEGKRNVEFYVDVWDGNVWQNVFYSDTNSQNKEWEQIIVPLVQISFVGDAQVRFTIVDDQSNNVADDVAIDDFFIGSEGDFIPYYPISVINNVDGNGVADSLGVYSYTSGVIASTSYYPYSTQSFTLIDTNSGEQEGIHVKLASSSTYVPSPGDFIMIRGTVGQVNGLQVFNADSVRLQEQNRTIVPREVYVPDESTESELITVRDRRIDKIAFSNSLMEISLSNGFDTIIAIIDTNTNVDDALNLTVGDEICSITGVGMQIDSIVPYLSGYYIAPVNSGSFTYKPMVDLGKDTSICRSAKMVLDAGAGFLSYSWNTGDTSQSIPVNSSDSIYMVSVTDANGCTASDTIKVVVTTCTGLAEFQMRKITVFPNPSEGYFKVKIQGLTPGETHLSIHDLRGTLIKQWTLNGADREAELELDLSDKAKGIYFIRIRHNKEIHYQKLIIQ